jgi:Na+-driven multidrug efflux pump
MLQSFTSQGSALPTWGPCRWIHMKYLLLSQGTDTTRIHTVVTPCLDRFVYLTLILAVSNVVAFRISNLVIIGNLQLASVTSHACVLLGLCITCCCSGFVYLLSSLLATVFTGDSDVQGRVVKLATIAACFQLPYGLTGTITGILRGLGHQYLLSK